MEAVLGIVSIEFYEPIYYYTLYMIPSVLFCWIYDIEYCNSEDILESLPERLSAADAGQLSGASRRHKREIFLGCAGCCCEHVRSSKPLECNEMQRNAMKWNGIEHS